MHGYQPVFFFGNTVKMLSSPPCCPSYTDHESIRVGRGDSSVTHFTEYAGDMRQAYPRPQ
jgi:hypothetical protein